MQSSYAKHLSSQKHQIQPYNRSNTVQKSCFAGFELLPGLHLKVLCLCTKKSFASFYAANISPGVHQGIEDHENDNHRLLPRQWRQGVNLQDVGRLLVEIGTII